VNDPAGASAVERQISVNVALRAPIFVAPPTSTSGTTTSAPPVAVAPPAADVSVKDVGATGDGGNSGSGVVAVPPLNAPANNAGRGAARTVTVQTGSTPSASAQSATGGTDIRRQEYAIPELDKVAAPVAVLAKAPILSADRPSNSFELLRTRTVVENSVYVDQMRKVMSDSAFVNDVQKVRDDIIKFDGKVIASTTAVSASLSIGYVIWLVRGGALISSLLASIPAWQLVDPLPVLGNMGGGSDTDDDESLDDMIKKSRANRATATSATEPIKMAAQT
jgi:hypothetical protein